MKRRGFLASLLAGAGAVATSKRVAAEPLPAPLPDPADQWVGASLLPTGATRINWKEPVPMPCELPILADEGDGRFVLSEDRFYIAVIDGPEKLVDVDREGLRDPPGFGIIRHSPDEVFEGGMTVVASVPEDAATKAYVDGVALRQGEGVLLASGQFLPPAHYSVRKPGHWLPVAAAGASS